MAKTQNPTDNKKKEISPVNIARLQWQGALRLINNRVFKIRSPQGHGTGFHIGNFGNNDQLCAIATALHVVAEAHEWGESIKVIHAETGKEILLREKDRAIFKYADRDLAVILFAYPSGFNLPNNQIDFIPNRAHLFPGVDVGWCGFPAVKSDKLCFFHGYISCYLDQQGNYLIDGVAIHGVSGGPVFFIDNQTNFPKIIGVITHYIANRATGEALPGVSIVTSISPCEDTVKSLRNLSQAKKEAEEKKINDQSMEKESKSKKNS